HRISLIRQRRGAEYLHRLLTRIDSHSAAELFPRDWPRVQRALEIRLQTGSALSAQKQVQPPAPKFADRLRIFVLNPPRDELYRRINERTKQHFAAGLIYEVKDLLAQGVPAEYTALGAPGNRHGAE